MRRLLTSAILLVAFITAAHAGGDQIEPKAGTWKTWVISSGREFRVAEPPNEAATTAEIGEIKNITNKRDATANDLITYWNVGPPSYRYGIAQSAPKRDRWLRRASRGHAGAAAAVLSYLAVELCDATLRTRRKRQADRAYSRVYNIRVTLAPGSGARSPRT